MIGSGIYISAEDFRGMSDELRASLHDWLAGAEGGTALEPAEATVATPGGPDEEGGPADLSLAQCKRLLEGCSDKTKAVLRAVFARDERSFILDGLAKELGVGNGALGGAWAGITKRTRGVLGDVGALLIWWEKDSVQGHWTGTTSEMTFRSMRKALGIA